MIGSAADQVIAAAEAHVGMVELRQALNDLVDDIAVITGEGTYSEKQEALPVAEFWIVSANNVAALQRECPEPEFSPDAPQWAPEQHHGLIDAFLSIGERLRPLAVRLAEELGEDVDLERCTPSV